MPKQYKSDSYRIICSHCSTVTIVRIHDENYGENNKENDNTYGFIFKCLNLTVVLFVVMWNTTVVRHGWKREMWHKTAKHLEEVVRVDAWVKAYDFDMGNCCLLPVSSQQSVLFSFNRDHYHPLNHNQVSWVCVVHLQKNLLESCSDPKHHAGRSCGSKQINL